MEGSYWIRIGAILALLLGSVYVLLPTILQEDLESRLARQASEVEAPATRQEADLDVTFQVTGGDPAQVASRLGARLNAAGVPVARVTPEGDLVHVVLGVGGDPATVVALARPAGEVALADPRTVGGEPATQEPPADPAQPEDPAEQGLWPDFVEALEDAGVDPTPWEEPIGGLGQGPLPGTAARIPADIQGVNTVDGAVMVQRAPLPEGWPFAVVVIDEVPRGALVPADSGFRFVPFGAQPPETVALLASGPLGGTLTVQEEAEEVAAAPTEAAAPAQESAVPTWLLGLLPDTRMNLGLDLQGGLDLTLQVGLDEAVRGQVSRDAAFIEDQAQREGVAVESVRRDRTLPQFWIETAAPLADVQAVVRKSAPDYVYAESEGNRHGFVMRDERQEEVKDQAVDQVLETLRKRIDATGVKEPSIVKKGGGQINVQLPGEVDLQAAVDALGTTAVLEFHLVDHEFDDAVLDRIIAAAEQQMPPDQFADDQLLNEWLWDTGRLDQDRLVLWEYTETPEGPVRSVPLPLYNEAILTGNDVADAGVGWDQNQQPYVSLDFKPRGGRVFCDVTGEWVGKRFAIVLDDVVQSAPSIRERICGGSARIDMASALDPLGEAQTLALVLRTGSLDAPVDLGGVRQVGATLGQDSIRSGAMGAMVGSLVVVAFMIVWYKRSGLIADVALIVNVLLVLAALALFGATLTLPGIAGIALTVGMAVDANIIIYERIREELKLGVHPRKAVDVGFEKAVVAILDSNITTAIAGIVLFSYGTGPIKGFAVTLLIGIATTLITALFVTRTLMELTTRSSSARLSI